MRPLLVAVLVAVTACSKTPDRATAAQPAEIGFDGADSTNASAMISHGERLTHVLGCTGCHGEHLQGEQFEPEQTQYGPIYASNLTLEVPEYSDEQLDGIIRHGIHPERKTVWVMPSEVFQFLGASDYRDLAMYLRSLKPVGIRYPPPEFNALDRKEIAQGKFKPAVQLVPAFRADEPVNLGPNYALGRYIASVTCAECHGSALEGDPSGKPPNLIVAGGYTRGEFETLITRGVPTGGRTLMPLMSQVAKYRFSRLTPHERDALYAYLKARAERPQ